MKLTYPRSHELEDLVPLYEQFRDENPDVYQEWFNRVFEVNTSPYDHAAADRPDPTIVRVNRKVKDFLLSQVECNSADGLTFAIADFKKLMRREVRQHIILTRGEE